MNTRRKFLKIVGSSAVVLAAGGGLWAGTRDPKTARQAWENAGQVYEDPMRNALSYAILAPNPHNRQPWLVDLKSETEAVLYCQLDRLLPETDPFNRQITIGLGCFLETFHIAAAEAGYWTEITAFPEGADVAGLDARPIARLKLKIGARVQKDPLFATILERRTDRGVFDIEKPIAADALDALEAIENVAAKTFVVTDQGSVKELRELSWQAWLVEATTPAVHHESVDLMRIGKKEIEAAPDGISMSGPMMEALNKFGVLTRENLADPESSMFAQTLEFMRPGMETAMGYVVINTQDNDRISQIEAGRAYMRANLIASNFGVGMQPLSQALQEYPEMAGLYNDIHEKLAGNGETVQMFARIGYGAGAPAAPRWPLDTRIKNGILNGRE